MADEIARVQQYEYRQNSNLVLQVDFNFTDRRGRDEPTGEVMPLTKSILQGIKMGDKYQRGKAPKEDIKKPKKLVIYYLLFLLLFIICYIYYLLYLLLKEEEERESYHPSSMSQGGSLLSAESNNELMGLYKPRTQETKQTYEAILAYIQDALGDQVDLLFIIINCIL
ncbi:unnamed protein product [Anisakis simplex]|uniref:Small integral membrane protein 24 n=1 Tax=Anisakis simplex TaxID=6269 RepID=A0A0M3KC67_ANISI|nr:unnamed protein product [Anisakis simplex]